MATIDQYKISIEVSGTPEVKSATDAVGKLDDKIKVLQDDLNNVGKSFMNFATAASAALGALGISAIRSADEIVDLANATGISAAKIYQLGEAAEANGGKFAGVGTMIGKFSNFVDQAASGTEEAVEAFKKLGISKEEFESLSDEQLFLAFVQGLGKMDKGLEQTSLSMKAFGKDAKSIDFKGFARDSAEAVDPELQANLVLAADAVGSLETTFRTFQKVALSALAPVLQAVKDFEFSADDAKKVVQVLGALIAGAFSAKVVGLIIGAVNAFRTLTAVVKAAGVAQAFLTALVPGGIALVAAAGLAAGAAYLALGKYLDDATAKTKALGDQADKNDKNNKSRDQEDKKRTQNASKTEQAMKQQALAAQQVTAQMIRQNEEANQLREKSIDLIGVDSDRANLIKSNAQVESDGRKQVADLEAKIVAERAKGAQRNDQVIDQLEQQKNIVNGQVAEATRLNELEYQRTQQLRLQESQLKSNLAFIEFAGEVEKGAKEKIIRDQLLLGKIGKEEYNRKLSLIDAENKHLTEVDKLEYKIAEERKKGDLQDLTKIREYEGEVENLNLAWIQTKGILEANNKTIDATNKSIMAGAKAAMDDIAAQFEPYKQAQDAVAMGWRKVSDALNTFIETGKFSFKDFARSILLDLTKMIAQAMVFKYIFNPIMGALGLPIAGARAMGGPVSGNKPYLVGEKGPELFVPKNAGSVIPNNKLASSSQATGTGMVNAPVTNNYITNNISAVDAKSVAQLFAENRKTLLGTVQMAQREMPYGV